MPVRHPHPLAFAAVHVFAACAAHGRAQAQPPAAPQTLERMVVTATGRADDPLRVPAAVDVLDAATLSRAQPGLQLSESLPRIPGVVARDRQNQAQDLQLSIRGFGSRASFGVRGVRLYTDGIPATMPDGQGQVSHFPLETTARIEVLRGPYSALHGNASGGVVALYSADPPTVPTLRTGAVAGNDALRRVSLGIGLPLGRDRAHGLTADAARVDDDGYRAHGASRRESGQATLRGAFADGGRYTAVFNGLDLRAEDPQGLTGAQLRSDRRAASAGALAFDTRKTVRQSQAGLHVEWPLARAHTLAGTAWRGQRDTFQMLSVPVAVQADPLSGGGAIDLARAYGGVDLRWNARGELAGRPVSLTFGAQREAADERRRGFENFSGPLQGVPGRLRRDEDDRVVGDDAYLQLDWEPTARWRLNAGARRSEVRFATRDRFVTAANPDDSGRLRYASTSPVAGAILRAGPWLSLFANAGAGFETPTFAELAYRGDGAGGLNPLAPARSRSAEAGLRARRARWRGSATVFGSRTRDELAVASSSGGRSVFANAGPTRRHGAEAAWTADLAPGLALDASATWIDARRRESGARIPGIARHSAFAELRWSPDEHLDLLVDARATSRVYADDANTAAAPGHTRFDLAAERRWRLGTQILRAYARIENVFDRDIVGSVIVNEASGRYFEPAPGRQWLVGFSLQTAPGDR